MKERWVGWALAKVAVFFFIIAIVEYASSFFGPDQSRLPISRVCFYVSSILILISVTTLEFTGYEGADFISNKPER